MSRLKAKEKSVAVNVNHHHNEERKQPIISSTATSTPPVATASSVLDVSIDSTLAANLVSIAAAAGHALPGQNPPDDPLTGTIDPAIGLDARNRRAFIDVDEEEADKRLRQALESHNHHQLQQQENRPSQLASSSSTSISTVGPDGQPVDVKKACPFCGKTFSHPGSLGRHLDLKRGGRLHPAEQIDIIRGDVKRRGDPDEIKARRAKRARLYNSRDDVKERAKVRRKAKEKSDRAKAIARKKFIQRIGVPSLPPHPSFAYVVLYFLPPSQWPHDPPTKQTYDQLEKALDSLKGVDHEYTGYKNKIEVAFEQWSVMNMASKMEIWVREQRRAAEAALGSVTLYDLGSRDNWLAMEESHIIDTMDGDDENSSKIDVADEEDGSIDANIDDQLLV